VKTLPIQSGYKICYKEQNSNQYIRHFMTRNYKDALGMVAYYKRYPPTSREDNHKLKKPKWRVIPITIKEIYDGIWREVPF
jgi:hypothetical protein